MAGGVGQSREPKLSVSCLHISAHPFLAKNRPGAPVFGHCPILIIFQLLLVIYIMRTGMKFPEPYVPHKTAKILFTCA